MATGRAGDKCGICEKPYEEPHQAASVSLAVGSSHLGQVARQGESDLSSEQTSQVLQEKERGSKRVIVRWQGGQASQSSWKRGWRPIRFFEQCLV